ncbi:hypothetical protein HELRODRAFT_164617 [Helobdella robusta]|uniref:Ion transport domain-containing protein n=1 Tax=Helobdella robusta TaxID=6412 RepID=T1EVN2_HELRO|nr:hypothetical protein HELRODRAFT_164617 [Helobdella robusta]ESN92546.1 hypothetical protein HELRODRAFT_164617 [Helobdella robusta]
MTRWPWKHAAFVQVLLVLLLFQALRSIKSFSDEFLLNKEIIGMLFNILNSILLKGIKEVGMKFDQTCLMRIFFNCCCGEFKLLMLLDVVLAAAMDNDVDGRGDTGGGS